MGNNVASDMTNKQQNSDEENYDFESFTECEWLNQQVKIPDSHQIGKAKTSTEKKPRARNEQYNKTNQKKSSMPLLI